MELTKKNSKSAQEFLPIKEIRDGIVIMKDNSLKAVLMASSLNFALKATSEQDAIIFQYQNFLNSLDFSVQFFVQSRKLNIEPYLDVIRDIEKTQTNELLKIQTREYIDFVKNFVEVSSIVTKTFYVVVPFEPPVFESVKGATQTIFGSFLSSKKNGGEETLSEKKFEEYRNQLWQRVDTVAEGLTRTGVKVAPLNNEELIELYYGLFNPGESEKGTVPEIAK